MKYSRIFRIVIIGLSLCIGCAKHSLVPYEQVENTNYIYIKLTNGEEIQGTAFKNEPHQISVLLKNGDEKIVPKSTIQSIRRKPPLYDDFGKGISEEEIKAVKTNKHTVIYGLGGGVLSLGVSFFVGSAIQGSGSTLTVTMLAGGGLGTAFFINGGRLKDRRDAIEKIRQRRRSIELKNEEINVQTPDALQKQLEAEKKKQEDLRKQREQLLRDLGEEKKKKEN
jgi:hypothetical protein